MWDGSDHPSSPMFAPARSTYAGVMRSFSCRPLILSVCREPSHIQSGFACASLCALVRRRSQLIPTRVKADSFRGFQTGASQTLWRRTGGSPCGEFNGTVSAIVVGYARTSMLEQEAGLEAQERGRSSTLAAEVSKAWASPHARASNLPQRCGSWRRKGRDSVTSPRPRLRRTGGGNHAE